MKINFKIIVSFVFLILLTTTSYSDSLLFNKATNSYSFNIAENSSNPNIMSRDKHDNFDTGKILLNVLDCMKNKIIFIIRN